MFGDLNRAEIIGNITQDLEVRNTNSGTPVLSFGVATNRRYEQDGEWKEQTEFHNVVIWGPRAESFAQRAGKGTRIFVEGRLQTRSWEDENGKKNYRTEIVAFRTILLDRYKKGPADDLQDAPPVEDTSPSTSKPKSAKKGAPDEETIDPDDLPF